MVKSSISVPIFNKIWESDVFYHSFLVRLTNTASNAQLRGLFLGLWWEICNRCFVRLVTQNLIFYKRTLAEVSYRIFLCKLCCRQKLFHWWALGYLITEKSNLNTLLQIYLVIYINYDVGTVRGWLVPFLTHILVTPMVSELHLFGCDFSFLYQMVYLLQHPLQVLI